MSYIFSKVLEMSLYGSIAILVVLLFRLIFKKCPKKVMILFWIIVALRLVLPFNFNSPTSILNFGKFMQPKTVSAEPTTYDPETRLREFAVVDTMPEVIEQTPESDIAVIDNGTAEQVPAPAVTEQAPKVTFKTILPYIWLTVMVGLLIFSAIRYAIFYSRARWSSRSFDGRYYMANDIDSPFVVGIINPKIFFPINMDDDEREYVLNHEWTHIKNKDGLTKFLSYIVLCIHWFNPLVWLAFFMLCADIEMRVDEETTSNFNLSMVKEYCKSLVRHAADDNKGAFMQSTAFSGLSFGGMETKMRIKNLLSHKISSREIQIASICVTLVFSLLVSASSIDHQPWVREKPAEPEESAVIASETTESEPSETTAETTNSRRWSSAFIDPYIELIRKTGYDNQGNKLFYKYAFIYVDDDLIPELVTERPTEGANDLVSLYTFRNGKVLPVFEDGVYMDSSESYHYVPFEDFIIHHVILTQGELAEAKLYSMNDLMTGAKPKADGYFEGTSFSIDGKSVTQDEYKEFFRSREAEVITGKVGPDKAIEILNGQKTSGGTKIPSNISDDPAVSETTETTEETTAATASETTTPVETTVPAEDKLLSISKIKDFTVIPFVNESNNSTFTVSGEFGSIVCRILPEKVVRFTIKDKSFEYAIPSTSTGGIYLLKDYGKANIFIQFYVEGGNQICAYNVFDNGVFFKGAVNNATFERAVDNPRTFWIIENYGENAVVDVRRNYSMSKTTGMPAPDTYLMYTCFNVKMPLKSKVDLCGYLMINGTIYKNNLIYIYVGEKVTPVKTDEKDVIIIQKEDGTVLQVNFKDQKDRFYDSNNYRWVALSSPFSCPGKDFKKYSTNVEKTIDIRFLQM